MRTGVLSSIEFVLLVALVSVMETVGAQPSWTLKWRQDFTCAPPGTAGRSAGGIDLNTWTFDIGTRDLSDPLNPGPDNWGNNEPQYYTDRCELCVLCARVIVEDGGKRWLAPELICLSFAVDFTLDAYSLDTL
jgi:hypothetical protein